MRLWSIHPQYLDRAGLTAVWREGLLAQKVLQGGTRGYRHHPQLIRFQNAADPLAAIGYYLNEVNNEAKRRGYHFNGSKIVNGVYPSTIAVTRGQLDYEFRWLLEKLKSRQPEYYQVLQSICSPQPHPIFRIVPGGIAPWEKVR